VAKIAISARTVGVDGVLRRFLLAANRLPHDVEDAQRELGKAAEVVFGAFVPVKTGRELRGISSDMGGGVVTVTDFARNPESGFDYVASTRFGHGIIRPKNRQFGSFSLASKGRRGYAGHRGALRFTIGGRTIFAAYVKAWKPASDWVEDAFPEVEQEAQAVATRLGRTIESHF
jgi:hypothetical protein